MLGDEPVQAETWQSQLRVSLKALDQICARGPREVVTTLLQIAQSNPGVLLR